MSIQILPVQEADLPDLVHVYVAAFENDPIVGRLKAGLSESVRFQKILAYFRRLYAGTDVYGARFFKAVEGDDDGDGNGDKGKIVGFSKWTFPHHLTEEQLATKKAEEEKRKQEKPPEGMNVEFFAEFYRQLEEGRAKWVDHERTYFLHLLATLPSHHRRGIGTKLIAPGLAAADRDNAKAYTEATVIGLPLYLRHGWVPVGELRMDLDSFGFVGEGIRRQISMIREPRTRMKRGEEGEGKGEGEEERE